jgi:glycosyltransferase involved in cell wall biosynthesis
MIRALLWRSWAPAFVDGLRYSSLKTVGVGGTELQLLWHAQHLTEMGCDVQVLGTTPEDIFEEGVDFIGAKSRLDQERLVQWGRIVPPDIIFLEGAFHAAQWFRSIFPRAFIVHVGQNIDVNADVRAFGVARHVDAFAFVGIGHFADYCGRFPALRHKFLLLRNAVAWNRFHQHVPPQKVTDQVAWVGSWDKKGLRTWFCVMEKIMADFPQVSWALCGPAYKSGANHFPAHLRHGLTLPNARIRVQSLPLPDMLVQVARSRIVLVSLGNECGPGSILDAHAMGRPVVSGNDMVYKFSNPDGTGFRVSNAREAQQAVSCLLHDPTLCDQLGKAGRAFVLQEYSDRNQRHDLQAILGLAAINGRMQRAGVLIGTSKWQERLADIRDKVGRKWRQARAKRSCDR